DHHADRDAEDGQRRAALVGAHRVDGEGDPLAGPAEQVPATEGAHSCLIAAIGSRRDACRAGRIPATIPTRTPRPTPTPIDQGATAAGSGVNARTANASSSPLAIPNSAPVAERV